MNKMKVLVIGDTCKDVYVYGSCKRLCPDAPVPVLVPEKTVESLGMSGNVIENLDVFNISTTHITNTNPIIKKRFVDEKTNQMLVRVDTGDNQSNRVDKLDKINFSKYDAVIISDYNKGFLYESDIEYICNSHNKVFIDTKKKIGSYCKKAFLIKINDLEYEVSEKEISENNFYENLIITKGSKGATYKDKTYPVDKVDIKDQTGAGDTFISGLVYAYLKTLDIEKAINYANKCATYVVQKRGVSTTIKFDL